MKLTVAYDILFNSLSEFLKMTLSIDRKNTPNDSIHCIDFDSISIIDAKRIRNKFNLCYMYSPPSSIQRHVYLESHIKHMLIKLDDFFIFTTFLLDFTQDECTKLLSFPQIFKVANLNEWALID